MDIRHRQAGDLAPREQWGNSDAQPIRVQVAPNRTGFFNNVSIDINRLRSAYVRDDLGNDINSAFEGGRIIYADKNSQLINEIPGVRTPGQIINADYTLYLTKHREDVKASDPSTRRNSVNVDSAGIYELRRMISPLGES